VPRQMEVGVCNLVGDLVTICEGDPKLLVINCLFIIVCYFLGSGAPT